MKYLLDTCVISDFIKSEPNTVNRIKNTSPREIAVSSISVMEITYGLALNPERAKTIKKVIHDFLDTVKIIDFNQKDAEQAALFRALLKKEGTPIGPYDILLAGAASHHNLILVSSNIKEFNRIETLQLENWRIAPNTH